MLRQARSLCILLLLITAAISIGTPESITHIVKKVRPAVVTVLAYDYSGTETSQGTGFFIDSRHIVTNWHVIEDAKRVEVRYADGTNQAVVRIAAGDKASDLASLELASPNYSVEPLRISPVPPEPGERVIVVGSPMGLESSISDGVVSEMRNIPGLGNVIQISAPVSRGSSGSPVVNLNGEVVGVAQAIRAGGQNLNFATPAAQVLTLKQGKTITSLPTPPAAGRGPASEEKSYQAGRTLMGAKNYKEAVPHFLSVLRLNPKHYLAWFALGHCYTQMGQFGSAAEAFATTVKIRPEFAEAHASLGAALGLQGKFDSAIKAFKDAIRLDPESAITHYGLGLIYVATKDADSALKEYRILQRLDPKLAAQLFDAIY